MDMQQIFDNAIKSQRNAELLNSPQLLLGEIILKLEAVKNKELPLFIDLEDKSPLGIASWRGRYCELAIQTEELGSYSTDKVSWESDDGEYKSYEQKKIGKENPTVSDWIDVLKEAIGKSFVGYKGGDFLMSKNTPVWLAEDGNSSYKIDETIDKDGYENYKNVYFVDVEEKTDRVYLVTKVEED